MCIVSMMIPIFPERFTSYCLQTTHLKAHLLPKAHNYYTMLPDFFRPFARLPSDSLLIHKPPLITIEGGKCITHPYRYSYSHPSP